MNPANNRTLGSLFHHSIPFYAELLHQIKAIVARVDSIPHTPADTFFPHALLRDAPELQSIPGRELISAE